MNTEVSTHYNREGHIDGETSRVAMTVAKVIDLQNKGDVYSYTYDPEAAEVGLDPWRLVDSINPFTKEPKAELWFDNGGRRVVGVETILYVQQHKKAKDAIQLGKVFGQGYAFGTKSAEEIVTAISTLDPVSAAYVVLRTASGLPDKDELAIRQALLRRIAK